MCYIRMTDEQAAPYGRMRTVDEWTDMAQQMLEAGVLYLTLTGGECTQYPGFEELYKRLSKMGFLISIMSNAGAYTESIRDVFRKYPPRSVGITLYGGSDETYRRITGDSKGLTKALENIRFLQSIRVPVGLNFTMIRENVTVYPKVGKT
jgi:MoaA/NifB/PqqE/SkfB family radical SAM enzyme